MAKIVEALPEEAWRELLKRDPVTRTAEVRPTLMETPAEVARRLNKGAKG